MRIETDPITVTKDQLLKKKEAALRGIDVFENEVSEIEAISKSELSEAERIESLLLNLKKSRKLDSKKKAIENQKQKLESINKGLSDMEKDSVEELSI